MDFSLMHLDQALAPSFHDLFLKESPKLISFTQVALFISYMLEE